MCIFHRHRRCNVIILKVRHIRDTKYSLSSCCRSVQTDDGVSSFHGKERRRGIPFHHSFLGHTFFQAGNTRRLLLMLPKNISHCWPFKQTTKNFYLLFFLRDSSLFIFPAFSASSSQMSGENQEIT